MRVLHDDSVVCSSPGARLLVVVPCDGGEQTFISSTRCRENLTENYGEHRKSRDHYGQCLVGFVPSWLHGCMAAWLHGSMMYRCMMHRSMMHRRQASTVGRVTISTPRIVWSGLSGPSARVSAGGGGAEIRARIAAVGQYRSRPRHHAGEFVGDGLPSGRVPVLAGVHYVAPEIDMHDRG